MFLPPNFDSLLHLPERAEPVPVHAFFPERAVEGFEESDGRWFPLRPEVNGRNYIKAWVTILRASLTIEVRCDESLRLSA